MLKNISVLCVMLASLHSYAGATSTSTAEQGEKAGRASAAANVADIEHKCALRRYTFSWSLEDSCQQVPRGGTTTGTPVTQAAEPSPQWLALQNAELTDLERDRRAILAMAGAYQTSFEFLETVSFAPGYERSAPYQSWATEYVYVVEQTKFFISLQHIMVMFFADDGKVSGPMVMKHWRQDWQYQKPELLSYVGNNTWQKQQLTPAQVAGTWAQAVYQVDDSPRYESYGRWQHLSNLSSWESQRTWRPLPRREHSVRNDYQVLEGVNRHTITPGGWVHEQENYKLKLDIEGTLAESLPYLAKELGLNRYTRIEKFDFSAGDEYWRATADFWREVRTQWRDLVADHAGFTVLQTVDDKPLYIPLFERAQAMVEAPERKSGNAAFVESVLKDYVVVQPHSQD